MLFSMESQIILIIAGIANLIFIIWFITSINKVNANLVKLQYLTECVISNTNNKKTPVVLKLNDVAKNMGGVKEYDGREFESTAHAESFLHLNDFSSGLFEIVPKTV